MWGLIKAKRFLSGREKEQIIHAIQHAEAETSGEIRVHIESKAGSDTLRRAQDLFEKLGMAGTELRNGVLIYLAVNDRQFAIIGDQGIDKVVPENFWDDTKEQMSACFKAGRFAEGICFGIESAGEHLAKHFPHQADDVNELTDEISIGD